MRRRGESPERAKRRGYERELDRVREVYEADFAKHGVALASLGVPKGGQETRYRSVLDIGVRDGDSLLDVGCGFGDLYAYARDRGLKLAYTGIDICAPFIDAARERHPDASFRLGNLLEAPLAERWDWAACIGTLNLKLEGSDSTEYVEEMLRAMFARASRGIAVHFLSTYVDFQNPESYHCDPCRVFDFAKRELSPRVALRHDAMAYEFTLYVYAETELDAANAYADAQRRSEHGRPR